MDKNGFDIPVVLIIFNRPDLVKKQLGRLEKIKPEKLYIVSDGARAECEGETERVNEARKIIDTIGWRCQIIKIYAEKNMGCDRRIVSGLFQVFKNEEQAVILEDDCLPHINFFDYCRAMLEKYKDNPEVMYISGTKWVQNYPMEYSYGFSYNTGTWGWATWRRAWQEWHWSMEEWQEKKKEWLKGIYSRRFRMSWIRDMEKYFEKDSIPWDYVWRFCVGARLSIFPAVNLIENVGFGEDATHTKGEMKGYVGKTRNMGEITHPQTIVPDYQYPKAIEKQYNVTFFDRVKGRLKRWIYYIVEA